VIYRGELSDLMRRNDGLEVTYTLTRQQPPGWTGYDRRIDEELLREVVWPAQDHPRAYICGPTQFVETAAMTLVALGYTPTIVKTERFGPTGGG
jgi:ferredoxin-NADP reductase